MSEVKTNKLTGTTSAGDIDVTSEGGAVTFQLQQGLAKCWANFNGTGTVSIRDSLNAASLTDNGIGDYSINFSNSFSNNDYATIGFAYPHASWNQVPQCQVHSAQTTALTEVWSGASDAGGLNDTSLHNHSVHGDLA